MVDLDPEAVKILSYRAKAELRKRGRALRNTIPAGSIAERSAKIRNALTALPCFAEAKTVALFWPIVSRNEVDLRPLVEILTARGASVAFPAINPDTRIMTFRFVANPHAMEERGLGFAEPGPEDPEAGQLDIIVCPALGIDSVGNRLGYGAGYYDRTLPRFCPPALSIGVVFDFQLLVEVPFTEGDVPVNMVVTDERIFRPA